MNKLLLASTVALALTVPAATHAQQRAPHDAWCRDQVLDRGSVQVCSAYTYQQCMASRGSHTETCYQNPRYRRN